MHRHSLLKMCTTMILRMMYCSPLVVHPVPISNTQPQFAHLQARSMSIENLLTIGTNETHRWLQYSESEPRL